MRQEIQVTRIGMQVMKAELKWFKEVGDHVEKREHLYDAKGSVGNVKFYSKYTGTLVEKCFEDGPIDVGAIIGYIEEDEE